MAPWVLPAVVGIGIHRIPRTSYQNVADRRADSPAEAAGALPHGMILAVDGRSFSSPRAISGHIATKKPGEAADLLAQWDQEALDIKAQLRIE